MQIKRHKNKNEYYYAGSGLWVRNFTKPLVVATDINELIPEADMPVLLENEVENHKKTTQQIDTENFDHPNIVIVSDGYQFSDKHKLLESLPQGAVVMGVNGALIHWQAQRRLNFYVVNNPYPECMNFLPSKVLGWPRSISSARTYPPFLERYGGVQYQYSPTPDRHYSGVKSDADYFIDDYRNPVCAAIGITYHFKVKKLLLLCCDEVFDNDRPGSQKLKNGLYTYPQQKMAQDLIDGNLYWLMASGVKIGNHSSGPDCVNATYITAEEIAKFFN